MARSVVITLSSAPLPFQATLKSLPLPHPPLPPLSFLPTSSLREAQLKGLGWYFALSQSRAISLSPAPIIHSHSYVFDSWQCTRVVDTRKGHG